MRVLVVDDEAPARQRLIDVLRNDANIAEAVVIGLPHQRWTEAITAIVVPAPGTRVDEGELLSRVKQRLAGFKVPKAIVAVDELPRTSTGKIQKNVLRDRYARFYDQQ